MRPSLRFLGLVIVGWVGLRSVMLGAIPGGEMFRLKAKPAATPPIVATEFAPIDGPVPAFQSPPPMLAAAGGGPGAVVQPAVVRIYYTPIEPARASWSAPPPAPPLNFNLASMPQPGAYAPIPALDRWPLANMAAATSAPLGMRPPAPGQSAPAAMLPAQIDRWQVAAWAMLRAGQNQSASGGLATGSTLGASQAGARIGYNFSRQVAGTLRTTNAVGERGGEVALGARVQPVRGIPIWATLERRQRVGKYGSGRNAFALFFEGGLWDRPLPMNFRLDGYLQGGVVGLNSRDAFIDGGVTATRPVYRNFSAGFGLWGGAQPGVHRIDAGPRVTMKVRDNLRVHVDYRMRLAGNAEPGSGPTLTLAGDF